MRGALSSVVVVALAASYFAACDTSSSSNDDAGDEAGPPGVWLTPLDPNPRGPFPAGFMFGSSTSAFQIESGLNGITDFGLWSTADGGAAIDNGDNADNEI